MTGWLVVNCFIDSKKFTEIYCLLLNAAKEKGIKLILKKTDELVYEVSGGLKGITPPDFAIFWDKDIYLAKQLENLGIRLFNSASSIELCDNKALTALRLAKFGISSPKTVIAPKTFEGTGFNNMSFLDSASKAIGFPMVIKEVFGSFGQQVYLAENSKQAKEIIKSLGFKEFIMQEYISEHRGMDIRINAVGSRVTSAMLRFNNNDFRSNISNGGISAVYTPTAKQCRIAIDACKAFGLDFAGVDILLGENDIPLVCEINSNPHFKSTLECTGDNLAVDIMEYISECIK